MQGTDDWWKWRAWLLLLCAWSVDVIFALDGRGPAAASQAAFVHALARSPIWCPHGPLRLRVVRDAVDQGRASQATSAITTPLHLQCVALSRAPIADAHPAGGAAFGRVQGRKAPGPSQPGSWGWGSRGSQPGRRHMTTMLRVSRRDRESLAGDKRKVQILKCILQ